MAGDAQHILLYGGSRSGKTFLILRAIAHRAICAARSRHAVLRFRLNHLVASVLHDTWPKMLELCYPGIDVKLDKQNLFATFPNQSQVWFGGLDDKERTEKVLGQEHSSIFLNECSQIAYEARNIAATRLAQRVDRTLGKNKGQMLPLRMYYDENPPSKGHWSYRMFVEHVDPSEGVLLEHPEQYVSMQMNPVDNEQNLAPGYLDTLGALPARLRKRFLRGEFADANPNALWQEEVIERWRVMGGELPDMQRVVIGVDPSGGNDDEPEHDEVGILVIGLGTDAIAYVLEDLTLQAGPARWGKVATTAYDRHGADKVIGEVNYGGAMVEHVVKVARPGTPFKAVTASRGKVVRAEPAAALYDDGRVRHVGEFRELEQELCAFSTTGYTGEGSPNRADALIWALYELFPVLTTYQESREHGAAAAHVHAYKRKRAPRVEQSSEWVV